MGEATVTIDEIISRDPVTLRAALATHLGSLGWGQLWAKEQGGVQTLLEHSLAVYDVLVACLPFIAEDSYPRLTADEALTVLLAGVAHDAGKADPAFQMYLRHNGLPVEHVDADTIRGIVDGAARAAGIDLGPRIDDVVSGAVLHEKRMRLGRGELVEWARSHVSLRWRKLADAVNLADSVASSPDVISAEDFLQRSPALTGRALVTAYHVNVRGVSTTFLHDATLRCFEGKGWTPVVHFADGTVFVGRDLSLPSPEEIEAALRERLEELLRQQRDVLPGLALGNPLYDFLPNPHYVLRDNLRDLFEAAARKVAARSEIKPDAEAKYRTQWREECRDTPLTPKDLVAIGEVGPEACTFKLLKQIVEKVLDDAGRERVRSACDSWLGVGAYDDILRQSTYMAVHDYVLSVRRWHRLPAEGTAGSLLIGDLDPQARVERLRERIVDIVAKAIQTSSSPLPSDKIIQEWERRCLADLTIETSAPTREQVVRTLTGYAEMKAGGKRANSPLQCCQCATLILAGDADAPSDALGNLGTFSNRRLAFAPSGSPPVCKGCTVDLTIGQLSLGSRVEVVIALIPRRSIGPAGAREVVCQLRELRHDVDRQLSPQTADLSRYLSVSLPAELLRAAGSGASLSECMLRPVSAPKTRKKRIEALEEALKERLGDTGLRDLNAQYAVAFDSVASLAEAIYVGQVSGSVRDDRDVADAVKAISHDVLVDFAAVTPNLVVMSLDRKLGGKDDSDADRALFGFGLAALFALEFGMATVVAPLAELRTALATRTGRTVYVPANAPARRLLGGDWVDLETARTWLRALQGAIALRERAGARSLLEVLSSPSAGFLIRRIEQNGTEETGPWWPGLWSEIEALKEVLG
jgi:hypothetical protein